MSMSVGASSNALTYLQQLLQQGTAGASAAASAADPLSELLQSLSGTGTIPAPTTATAASSAAGSGTATSPAFGSDTMAALISLQGQSASSLIAQSPSQLFAKIDTNGDGQISKSEFESALSGAGVSTADADTIFAKLDANSDGTVSQSELAKTGHGGRHHMHGGGHAQGGSSSQSPLDAMLSDAGAEGATTQATTNADGSTTTTITYADGTKIDMTTPAAAAATSTGDASPGTANGDKSSANLLEQLIKLQSQLLTTAASTLSAIA